MKIYIDTDVDNVVILEKKTPLQFIRDEFFVFLSQIVVFFWVTFLVSGSLRDEDRLIQYLDTKINDNSLFEVGHIILGSIITFGIILMIVRALPPWRWLDELADNVLISISRTIYFFGSSVTGSILAVALYTAMNPSKGNSQPESWLVMSLIFGLGAFMYGCGSNYAFNHKKYIFKPRSNNSEQNNTD